MGSGMKACDSDDGSDLGDEPDCEESTQGSYYRYTRYSNNNTHTSNPSINYGTAVNKNRYVSPPASKEWAVVGNEPTVEFFGKVIPERIFKQNLNSFPSATANHKMQHSFAQAIFARLKSSSVKKERNIGYTMMIR